MADDDTDIGDKQYGLSKEKTAELERLLKFYAERSPTMENTILKIAQEVGLTNVVARIKRLRRYAKQRSR